MSPLLLLYHLIYRTYSHTSISIFPNVNLCTECSQVETKEYSLWHIMEDGVEDHFNCFSLGLCFAEL